MESWRKSVQSRDQVCSDEHDVSTLSNKMQYRGVQPVTAHHQGLIPLQPQRKVGGVVAALVAMLVNKVVIEC